MKKILIVLIEFIGILSLSSCDLIERILDTTYDSFHPQECGDWIYTTTYCNENECKLIGLTEEGLSKETLVFPTYIDGYKVDTIGAQNGYHISHEIVLTNARNIYFHSLYTQPKDVEIDVNDCNFVNIFSVSIPPVTATHSFEYINVFGFSFPTFDWTKANTITSNVNYYIDEDEVFFVDDCSGTKVNVIPPDPYKDGYIFEGWYKDLEYSQEWDFENDIIPIKKYDIEGNYLYQETKIYAKWEKE